MKNIFRGFTLFVLAGFLSIGACDSGDNTTGYEDGSSKEDDGPVPDANTADQMYVKFLSSKDGEESFETFQYQVLPTFDASSTCKIDKTETSNKDLSCVVDVNEQDLYFHGLRIEFVIPTGMCDYTQFRNTWHYDQEMGSGPRAIWVRRYVNDQAEPSGTPECFVRNSDGVWYPSDPRLDGLPANGGVLGTGDDCTNLGTQPIANASGLEMSFINPQTLESRCIYDKTDDSGGDNCCRGNYDQFLEVIDNQDTPDPADPISKGTEVTTNLQWGPAGFGECVSGTAVVDTNWPKVGDVPVPVIYYTREAGQSDRYEIPEPALTFNNADNHLVANWHSYVEGVDTRHEHTGPISGRTSYLPIMFDPIEDRSGDFQHIPAQIPYEIQCMNEDFETIHRIRMYIREYNTEQQFQDFIANPQNGTQDADRTGTEGGGGVNDCEGFLGNNCNDRSDPDDFAPDTPGDTPPYDCSSGQGGVFGAYTGCFPYVRDNN